MKASGHLLLHLFRVVKIICGDCVGDESCICIPARCHASISSYPSYDVLVSAYWAPHALPLRNN